MTDDADLVMRLPRKREAADALLLDSDGRALIVQNPWDDEWNLPGGVLESGEPPRRGAEREIAEELGLQIRMGALLVVDWEPPNEVLYIDGTMTLFDGGVLTPAQIAAIRPQESEIKAVRFVAPAEFTEVLLPHHARRMTAAITARRTGVPVYLEDGYPPT